jgi:hypothetical protein
LTFDDLHINYSIVWRLLYMTWWYGKLYRTCGYNVPYMWCTMYEYRICGVQCTVNVVYNVPYMWCTMYRICGVQCTVHVVYNVPYMWCTMYRTCGVQCTVHVIFFLVQ